MRRIRKLRMAGCDVYVHVHMPWTFSGGWEKGKRKARKKGGGNRRGKICFISLGRDMGIGGFFGLLVGMGILLGGIGVL